MTIFQVIATLVTLAAIFSFINYRYIKFPTTIGLMALSLSVSLVMIAMEGVGWFSLDERARSLLNSIDFYETLMHGMLTFLLFAGALHVNLDDLRNQTLIVFLLATAGVLASTFLVGSMTWQALQLVDLNIPIMYCLLFGALISPTDPIAVIGIMKKAGAPKSLETTITGESLFNDGIGVVVFLVLLSFTGESHHDAGLSDIGLLFVKEAIGGLLYGGGLGYLTYQMLKRVDNYQVEVLITLATVTGGYALAEALHVSAPLAIVVAGLLVGNHGRTFGMSETTRIHLDTFWELVDEVLNAVLFVLLGLEILILPHDFRIILIGFMLIPVVLLARFIIVGSTVTLVRRIRECSPGAIKIITWAGLRGGISVALALSLPKSPERDIIVTITYVIMVFSILVQGLSVGRLIDKCSVTR
ncbi:MAG: sodium:proton antiporter [Desulfobulbaceae bacterium]|nr:sodium:proton antiporter [Desulfobulbaceae bacterium]